MRHTISLMILRGTENITTFLPWYEQHIKQIVKTNQNSSWKITAWRHFRFLKQKTDLTQKNSDSKWWFCSLLLFSNNFQFCHRWSFFSIFIIKRGPGFPLSMVFLLFWFYVDFLLPKKSGWFRLVFQAQTLRTNSRYFSKIGFLAFSETLFHHANSKICLLLISFAENLDLRLDNAYLGTWISRISAKLFLYNRTSLYHLGNTS